MKKYLADSKMFEFDKYYRECQKTNIPFVKARKNPVDNNYLVQLDLITCNYNLSKIAQRNIQKLFQNETGYLENTGHDKSIFKGSNVNSEHAWYDGILPERLDKFCSSLFDFASTQKI
ncbi:MAG: hypothetical protein GTN97_01800 [Nitrosopumilaceae archaeon]|nr:hypothetical protein [Nitrosopumilaceae archaeon]NIP09884.1 hypothetical protein [Nitrosopumilaceae archaeon]NIS94655.1 hypothetical protein [Nitrosopumilaceae archaeon]